MTFEEIERLSRAARDAGITRLDWADQDGSLMIRFTAAEGAGGTPDAPAAPGRVLASPAVGHFRLRHPVMDRPFAEPGAWIDTGQIVGFVQASAVLHPVVADGAGTLGAPMCQDGAPVGYGTPLFRLA